VKIDFPLQAYFRINAENMGQFERTLIIVDEGARCTTSKAAPPRCTAPKACTRPWSRSSSSAAPLPLHDDPELGQQHLQPGHQAGDGLRDATMEWVDGNLGSKLTMKYPAVYMMEPGARGEILSIAFAGQGPASGRRRQAGPLRAEHHRPDHQQVDLQERRPQQLPRPGEGRKGRQERPSATSSATR
jgi:Fe-S cluster assembly scaffold protein SufB